MKTYILKSKSCGDSRPRRHVALVPVTRHTKNRRITRVMVANMSLWALVTFNVQAQFPNPINQGSTYISGPSTGLVNNSYNFYFNTPGSSWSYNWSASGGTVTSISGNRATIRWNSTGNRSVSCSASTSSGVKSASKNVNVSAPSAPSTPATPTIHQQNCGNTVLRRGSPPTGVTWYWQGTNSNGTSTSQSGQYYTTTSSGWHYLRARNSSGQWSTSSSAVNSSVKVVPGTPAVPSMTQYCGYTRLYKPATTSSVSYYWTSGTTITSSTAASYKDVTSPGTYYLRSRHSNGCWSNVRSFFRECKDRTRPAGRAFNDPVLRVYPFAQAGEYFFRQLLLDVRNLHHGERRGLLQKT